MSVRKAEEIRPAACSEYHVASYIVACRPEDAAQVVGTLQALEGVEVHGEQSGRLVVTAEAGGARELAALTERLQLLPGIVNVAPVYHEYSSDQDGNAPGV